MKNTSKIGQLKYEREYISSNDFDKLQDNFPRIVKNENKDDDYSVNIFLFKKLNEKMKR